MFLRSVVILPVNMVEYQISGGRKEGGFMDLFSLQYILFVLILAVVYYTVGKKKQWIVLLAASLLYYSVLSLGGILFLLVNAISTYLGAQLLFSL